MHPLAALSLDDRWFLDVNRFARDTSWLHGFMRVYAHDAGAVVLGLLVLLAWWVARRDRHPDRAVAFVLWAAAGTVIAWAVSHYVLKPVFAELRPYLVLPHVEVLAARTSEYSFPSGHATVAGAVIAGLWLARRWILASIATVLGLLLAFGRVYVGMHFPADVAAGLAFGAAVVLLLAWPAVALLQRLDTEVRMRTPFGPLVSADSTWGRMRPPKWRDHEMSGPPLATPAASGPPARRRGRRPAALRAPGRPAPR